MRRRRLWIVLRSYSTERSSFSVRSRDVLVRDECSDYAIALDHHVRPFPDMGG